MIGRKNTITIIRAVADFLILNFSFIISGIIAQSYELLVTNNFMYVLLILLNFTWFFSAGIFKLYDELNTNYLVSDLLIIIKNSLVQVAVSIAFLFVIKEPLFLRNFILLYFVFLTGLVVLKKIIFKYFIFRLLAGSLSKRKVVIVGSGEIGRQFLTSIQSKPNSGYQIIGFVDNELTDSELWLGKIEDLEAILINERVDDVVIALPNYEFSYLDSIIKICNRHAVRVHLIPDYLKYISSKFQMTVIDNMPIITVRKEPLAEFYWRFYKRIFDIVFSSLFLILIFSWLFPLIAIAQKITTKGSIFFIQKRVGMNDKTFNCFKFRSMNEEIGIKDSLNYPLYDDSEVTRFGKFLRKSNLDETPQFINVLLGDMSIVGPRPAALPYNKIYKSYIDELKLRNIIKPGITGWAQIHGLRGDSPDDYENRERITKRFEYDLWYIENWSYWLDLQIIFITVWQMIKFKSGR